MSDNEYPVYVVANGEKVQVGTALRQGDGFILKLGELTVGAEPSKPATRAARPAEQSSSGPLPTVFPPYGRSKGAPIAGANRGDLEFYATGAKRTLADPSKARFHDKERTLLAVLEAELARQGGGDSDGEPPPPSDDDFGPEAS